MAYTLINLLDNYANRLKCLNDQGGKFVPEIASITFPIRFNEVLAVLPMMLDEPTPWHEMMIRPKAITASTFKMVSGSDNTNYPKSRNNGCWIAVGI